MQAHFIDPSEDSEENLHSFQGNEAGQDLHYEPGLEFDDTELAKAAIGLHLAKAAGTPLFNFKTLIITLVITSTALSHTFTFPTHLHLERIHISPSVFE